MGNEETFVPSKVSGSLTSLTSHDGLAWKGIRLSSDTLAVDQHRLNLSLVEFSEDARP